MIPKNLLEKLHSIYRGKKQQETDETKDSQRKTRILKYFYWIDFISFCWLISLVFSIISATTILLGQGQLNIINKIRIIRLILFIWSIVHSILLVHVVLKVKRERESLLSRNVSSIIWVCIGMITALLIYFSLACSLNSIILLYVFLFCIYLGLCLFQQYRLMPVTALLELWRLVQPIERQNNK